MLSDEVLDIAIAILKDRVSQLVTQDLIPSLPDIRSYLYGWLNLTGDDQATDWVRKYSKSDEVFLLILNHFRGWAMGDQVYYPLSKDAVTQFFDWDDVVARLESMEGGEFSDQVADIQLAIAQSEDW